MSFLDWANWVELLCWAGGVSNGLLVGFVVWRPNHLNRSKINYLRDRNTQLAVENAKLRKALERETTQPSSEIFFPSVEASEAITLPKIPSYPPPKGRR